MGSWNVVDDGEMMVKRRKVSKVSCWLLNDNRCKEKVPTTGHSWTRLILCLKKLQQVRWWGFGPETKGGGDGDQCAECWGREVSQERQGY